MTEKYRDCDCGCQFDIIGPSPLKYSNRPAIKLDYNTIPLNCQKTWDLIASGKTKGIFQLESRLGKQWTKKLKPEEIEHIAALGALLRPGCISGDTPIHLFDDQISIRELYTSFKQGQTIGSAHTKDKIIFANKIFNVISTGVKTVYRLYLKKYGECTLEATIDHLIFTRKGWKELGKLNSNDSVAYIDKIGFIKFDKFDRIEIVGEKDTYDIRVIGPHHNFIAGNIVVHNCLKAIDENGISMTDHYCKRKSGEEEINIYHESLREILLPTYGVLTYQEQAIKIAQKIAGFSAQEADTLRKCITDDTMFVSKTRGWISIQRLLIDGYQDDDFLVMHEDGTQEWKKIEKIWHSGYKNCSPVESVNGFEVMATGRHEFLTNNGFKEKRFFQKGDELMTCRFVEWEGQDRISESLAVVLGALVVSENPYYFLSKNKDYMNLFVGHYINAFGKRPTKKSDAGIYVDIKERLMINKYLEKGFFANPKLPPVMMGMTKESTRKFLSFLLGSEMGMSVTDSYLEFSTESKDLAQQIQLLLLRFGVVSSLGAYDADDVKKYCVFINDIKYRNQFIAEGLNENWPHNKKITIDESVSLPTSMDAKYDYELIRLDPYKPRWRHVYDFTMKDGQAPYLIANGLVIHNSIGKKLPEEMAKVKKIFIEGAKKTGIVTEEEAQVIFGWIEKSQRYSFNKSHAVSYGMVGYQCAYVKAHFILEFFCSWLHYAKDKQDTQQEIRELIDDAKLFNIEIYPPSILIMDENFSTDGKDITFGLCDVKGIGTSQINKLKQVIATEESLYKPLKEWSWYDFLIKCSHKISKSVMEPLILVGAFRHMRELRSKMFAEYQAVSELTKKEIEWVTANYQNYACLEDLLEAAAKPKKEGGGASNKNRSEIIKSLTELIKNPIVPYNDSINDIAANEELYLGIPITCMRIDGKPGERWNTTCKDIVDGKGSSFIIIKVEVNEVREITIKKGKEENIGKKMAFLRLSDSSCSIEDIMCYPEQWEDFKDILLPGELLEIQLERGYKKDKYNIKQVWSI